MRGVPVFSMFCNRINKLGLALLRQRGARNPLPPNKPFEIAGR
jgi:hypothetical protein